MNKSRAALTHFWPSALGLAIITSLILFVWYPYPFLQFKTNGHFSLVLVFCASLIGPALTWLVDKQGKSKRALAIDLIVIILIQTAAIAWGTLALYQNRPYFMVFTVDRFEVLSIRDVDISTITHPKFLDKPTVGPVLVYATMPTDPQTFQKLLKEIMFEGKPDLQFRPEFWSMYAERQQLALKASRPLNELRLARLESVRAIDSLVNKNGGDITRLNFVPGIVQDAQFAAILDASSGELVDTLTIDAWLD